MLHVRSLESEHRLAEVTGQMISPAQQDGEAIPRRIFTSYRVSNHFRMFETVSS
jgi:hypothetical protein